MPRLGNNGGLMGLRRVPSSGSASGMWDCDEQSLAKRAALWPANVSGSFRYWRFANFANTTLDGNALDLTEIELGDSSGLLYGITITANFTWDFGAVSSMLNDGGKNLVNRVLHQTWSDIQSSATLTFDFGTAKKLTSLQIFTLYTQVRFPASFDLQVSTDGTNWDTHSTVTVGTFTDQGSGVWASPLISL